MFPYLAYREKLSRGCIACAKVHSLLSESRSSLGLEDEKGVVSGAGVAALQAGLGLRHWYLMQGPRWARSEQQLFPPRQTLGCNYQLQRISASMREGSGCTEPERRIAQRDRETVCRLGRSTVLQGLKYWGVCCFQL